MSSEWIQCRLGDVITLKRGYDLPKQSREHGYVPIVSSSGISDYHSVAMAKSPGVVTGRYGTMGNVYFLAEDYVPLNTTLYVKDFKGNDPRFISYHLRSIDFNSCSDKAAVPGVNRNHLHELETLIPPIAEQKAIAHILGTLDDKIELNRKTNETLEAMAKALFKSWFVDFDLVRAKAERRPTGLPAEISDLFPDSFEDSELGEIPSGWIVGKIRDLIEKTGMGPFGSRMKTETFQKSGVPIIKGGNLKGMLVEGCGHDYLSSEHAAELKSSCVRAGDFVITHRGTLGQVSMVPLEGSVGEYIVSKSQFYLRPASIAAGIYLLFFFHSPVGQNRLMENSSGVGVPSLARPSTLTPEIDVLLPPYPLLDLFAKQAAVVQKTFLSKQDEMDTLGSLRDALLPKLISGELRIPDAEKILEEAGL
jgi:type I restriction enzyme S subunit